MFILSHVLVSNVTHIFHVMICYFSILFQGNSGKSVLNVARQRKIHVMKIWT